ncbi:hypothetical protein [Stenotrophomonas sp. GZD-301]|uniref:hypothetical protein n=1 Tax=Stenotrophomonas sp. GZD-301 TaxID=3404814 RepID=UPI003BB51302
MRRPCGFSLARGCWSLAGPEGQDDMVAALGQRSLLMITHDELPEGIVHRSYRLRESGLE